MYLKASNTDKISQREIKHKELALLSAKEGIVLLKNNGSLPLENKTVALFGAGGIKTVKGGTGSGDVNERHSVTIEEGLKNRGFQLECGDWNQEYLELYNQKYLEWGENVRKNFSLKKMTMFLNEHFIIPNGRAVTEADISSATTDTAIYVVTRLSGEGEDLKNVAGENALSSGEIESIRLLAGRFNKFILIINTGSLIDISGIDDIEGINAIIYFSQMGMEGGNALADILLGETSPSGKLTSTWAEKYSDIPFGNEYSYMNKESIDGEYKEGIYVGYRYFDTFKIKPKYEFGYGLSYTNFKIIYNSISRKATEITLQISIKNIGKTAGKEVAQVYVSCPNGKLKKEYQRLIAYAKTKVLLPGESQTISITFDIRDCSSYDTDTASYILEKGNYVIRIGNSSRNTTVCSAILLTDTATVSTHENLCNLKHPLEELVGCDNKEEKLHDIETLTITSKDIKTEVISYKETVQRKIPEVESIIERLNEKELCELAIGSGIFTNAKVTTLGAVGNTTVNLRNKGVPNVSMVDGPAGIRVRRRSVQYKNGKVKMLEFSLEQLNFFPSIFKKVLMGNEKKGEIKYLFATAFPIGTALAQTWNVDLLEEVGKAISVEMTEFGATFWLAPALNIHRNPLCGRNFEYYSEDPVISGNCALSITKGVQSENGNYVTIKHFACNNQEHKRNTTSSNLSERTLREIYLKGFEICVKGANPRALMTAYNKINGVYTPNSHDLNTKILRNEWGFDGVVMTDWVSTQKGLATNAGAVNSGNDLIMPGGKKYFKDLYKSYKNGEVTKETLIRVARNVLISIVESKEYSERKALLKKQ